MTVPCPPRRLFLTGTLSAALALAACGSGPSSSTGAASRPVNTAAPVELTWWTGQTEDSQAILTKLVGEFTTAHPNVKVKLSSGAPTTDELLQKISAAFASGTYPDISYAYGSWATQLGQSGKVLDLTAKVADPAVGWSQFPPAARETATPLGRTIGFPAVVDDLSVIYNPALFAAAGVPEPTPAWTWADFRAAAKKITDPSRNVYGTAYAVSGSEDTTWHLWPLLWQHGGEILSADGKRAAFNGQAGVDALEYLRALAVDDRSVYLDQTGEKYAPLFAAGRIGMIVTGPWHLLELRQKKTPYKVAVLPGTNGNHQTISGPDLWVLFDHHDADRAYWSFELTKWLTSGDVDARFNLAQGNLPLRSGEAGTAAFRRYVSTYPGSDVMFANLTNATKARPTVLGYPELSRYVGAAVSQVLQGAAQPKPALDAAARQADQALATS